MEIKDFIAKLNKRITSKKGEPNQIQVLINNKEFMKKLLDYSGNDIDNMCICLGDIMIYYALSNDSKSDYTIEELLSKRAEIGLFSIDEIKEKGFFTHSCNGNIIEMIRKNGLGSDLNFNEELYSSVSRLEQKLNTTGTYTKQQSGKKDEVYFTSAGATSFGYACNFAPERLFLGILRQEYDNSIPIRVGESKKDYYRKVIYQKFGENLTDDIMKDIETVIDGYFSDSNYIVSFPVDEVISSDNIYFEFVGENKRINLEDHIQANSGYIDFFTSRIGSNSNSNDMDNLVMINTVVPPEKLRFLRVPDRFDLIQLIALNKGLQQGEKIDYFTFDRVEEKSIQESETQIVEDITDKKEEAKKNKIFSYISKIVNKVKGFGKKTDIKRLPKASQNIREESSVKVNFKNALLKRLRVSPKELAENTERQQTENVQTQPDKEDGPSLDD